MVEEYIRRKWVNVWKRMCLVPVSLSSYFFSFFLFNFPGISNHVLRNTCVIPRMIITTGKFCNITRTRLCKYVENFTSKNWKKNQIKTSVIFHISAQSIDCGYSLEPPRRGGSNEYSQSMFLSRNKKNNEYPCKPQFYYIKVGV